MLEHLQRKISALESFSFEDETRKIIEVNKDKLADLQATQLSQGIDVEGRRITLLLHGKRSDSYAPFTIKKKKEEGKGLGAVIDRVTWYMTGELYKSLDVEVKASSFRFTSNSFKFEKLIDRSGVRAIGLTKDSRIDFINGVTRPQILLAYTQKVQSV